MELNLGIDRIICIFFYVNFDIIERFGAYKR